MLCLSIKEHHETHLTQGDYGAAMLIAKRMGLPPEYLSNIQKGKKRSPETCEKISRAKLNCTPWNKGITGYKLKCDRKNKRYSSKLNIEEVFAIRADFAKNIVVPNMENIGKAGPNGIEITYKILFIKEYAKKFNITGVAIKKIIENISWKDGILDARTKT